MENKKISIKDLDWVLRLAAIGGLVYFGVLILYVIF